MHVCLYACKSACMHACMYGMYVCMYVNLCRYVCKLCMYVRLLYRSDEIPGFFLLLKNYIFIARSEDTIFIFHV